jgi:hypothetical protein
MISQIAYPANLFSLSGGARHHERVCVVKTEFASHADAEFGELLPHLGCSRGRRCLEDFFPNRAGVFRIQPDLTAPECLPKNDGAAHPLAVVGRNSRIFNSALYNLRKDVRLGKLL